MKPISLKIRHSEIMRAAHAAMVRAGRDVELRKSHNSHVLEKARGIVAQARERDRLKRSAALAAYKALAAAKDAFGKISASTTSEVDHERWRERQALVEAELMRIIEGARRR